MFKSILATAAVLAFAAICVAQDSNFSQGPQYLMNYGDPHFLHPIQTPSLDLSAPRSESPNAPATEHTGQPDSPALGNLQNQQQVDEVYYGVAPSGLPVASNRITVEVVPDNSASPAQSVIFNAGVGAITNENTLRDQGYGVSIAQDAAYWRAHKPDNSHVYTNDDIARLKGN